MKIRRFLKILIIFLILIISITTNSFAAGDYSSVDQFDSYNLAEGTIVGNVTTNALQIVLTIVRNVALGWAFLMLIVIALKYMVATPDVKGQLKKDIPTYCVGAVLLFGASGLMQLLVYIVGDTL